jgi:hypothetical protein
MFFFLQNHNDNHKNSMAGNTFIIELAARDKIQAYMYTFTGIQDKGGNHLTQFTGLLLRTVDHIVDQALKSEAAPERSASAMAGSYLSLTDQRRARSVFSAEPY